MLAINQDTQEALDRMKELKTHYNAIAGSLIGGAAGDALGLPVEFHKRKDILRQFGPSGITEYKLSGRRHVAHISDDTQMTLFTANGLLVGDTRGSMRGIAANPRSYVAMAYLDWLKTQESTPEQVCSHERYTPEGGISWLLDVPELYHRRAPGNTCLSALESLEMTDDYLEDPVNDSKGCGGIMRVAPLGIHYRVPDIRMLDMEAAQISAITHGHSLGYMTSSVLVHILNRIVYPVKEGPVDLRSIVEEARDTVASLFREDEHIQELVDIIDRAIGLSSAPGADVDNIRKLGRGWVAEETLAIALYCSLRYPGDFSKAIIAAVNHSGDSDSTGAVTGNIVGALVGLDGIEDKWKDRLELYPLLEEMAMDLCCGCQMEEDSNYYDPYWESKYIYCKRIDPNVSKKQTFTFFWKADEENGEFSNWFPRGFVIDDFEYLHPEQYLMAQKAKMNHDSKRYTAILRATTPAECKALGKQVDPYDSKAWHAKRGFVIMDALRAKFDQHPDLKQKLLATGNSILAEASPYDKVWGIGIDAATAAKTDPKDWPGQNLLGNALMELRNEYRRQA